MAGSARVPMVLVVLDGWGHSARREGNAIAACSPSFMDRLAREWPSALMQASGASVGLPDGYMGNSEVGHLCLGAGRVVLQDLARINRAIADGSLQRNEALALAIEGASRPGAALHLIGLLSDGGVHSHIDHFEAVVDLARAHGVPHLFTHAFLDGRDTPPMAAQKFVTRAEDHLKASGYGPIATVVGRYFAMDRDNHWERTEKAWRALVLREGDRFPDAAAAVAAAHARGEGDEFVPPAVVEAARPPGRDAAFRDGDAVVFFNFRADRARQITRAFTEEGFDRFRRTSPPILSAFVCFTTYDRTWSLPVAFPQQSIRHTFGEVVSGAGWPQLRIAETEKYAHVTYFFNGGVEQPFPGEERCLVPSPRVATYDLVPAMSAREVTGEVLKRLAANPGRLVVLNYANADMVGHTGKFAATIEACRVLDQCVESIVGNVLGHGGALVITADHGNAEEMIDAKTGGPVTAHTTNPVPVHVVESSLRGRRLRDGGLLADVAPTMLEMMGIPIPAEMEGRSLLRG
jgi:2,3-bisphosphoglycerate-independent phosphoglycerate mutase